MSTSNTRSNAAGTARTVFVAMFREEWRMHTSLFGGRRFAAFPVFVAGLVFLAAWALVQTGTGGELVVAGLHVLAFLFGLQTGSIGFVGRDAMQNLLGDRTLLVFSGRTLPLSTRRLLGLFLAKDGVFYAAFFLLPMTLGLAVVVPPARLPVLWATLSLSFLWGGATTLAAIALVTNGRPGKLALLVAAGLVGLLAVSVPVSPYTPLGLFESVNVASAASSVGVVLVLSGVGLSVYDTEYVRPARTAGNTFSRWRRRLPGEDDALLVRTLLDVARSSGGIWKPVLSAGILFAVTAFSVDFAGQITGVRPLTGVGFGAVLGLTAFTTYNWLTQFDDVESYLLFPLDVLAVFRAKALGFLVVGTPTAAAFYAMAVVWRGASLLDAATGLALLLGLQWYLFGLTVYLTGFEPNQFLFDTVLFAGFTAAVAVVLVPVLVVGFVVGSLGATAAAALVLVAVVAGVVGIELYRRAAPKWEKQIRAG